MVTKETGNTTKIFGRFLSVDFWRFPAFSGVAKEGIKEANAKRTTDF